MLAEHEGEPSARLLTRNGLSAFVCRYRVAPHRYPAPMADAARAVRLVRQRAREWGIRQGGLALLGFSAGGHLACTTATQPELWRDPEDDLAERFSARPDRLILAYPLISMVREYHLGSAVALLGPRPQESLRRQLSNELHVTPANPPVFLFHTADDKAVPVSHSIRFAAACREQGVPAALHVYPSGPHGVGLAEEWPELRSWTTRMLEWLTGIP
jgi:acetyl esterase/lipase